MNDQCFFREDVPMTKSEVRAISLAKLDVGESDIVYDIGAGTGSVTVEAAMAAKKGHVYAFEKNATACALIRKNCDRYKLDNVSLRKGMAESELCGEAEIPAPDCVFIGGSGGAAGDILDCVLRKNPAARVVLNVIAMESLEQICGYCRERGIEPEIVLIQVSRVKRAGSYHMMEGLNPVYIISWGESRWREV